MAEIVYAQNDAILGSTAVASARTDTRLILANPVEKKLVNLAFTGSAANNSSAQLVVLALSAALSVGPRAVTTSSAYVLAAGVNRLFRTANSVALDTTGFAVTEYPTECDNPLWIIEHNGFVYLPWSVGGVIVYTVGGIEVARYDGVLRETSIAAFDSTNNLLYLADSLHARAIAMEINADGTLYANDEFPLSSCKNIVALVPSEAYLAVACRDRLALFTIADPTTPLLAGELRPEYALNDMVKVGVNSWWIASDSFIDVQADRFDYRNLFAIFLPVKGVFAISSVSGRVIGEADFNAVTPPDVVVDVNQPPTVDAGADQATALHGSVTGTASDPEGDPLTYLWSVVSGPGAVTFGSATALTSTFTLTVGGNYTLKLTVSDGTNIRSDTMRLIAANVAPIVNAGVDQAISATLAATLTGTASDPDGDPLTYLWTKTAGPGTATITSPTALSTGVTVSAYGTYTFQLAANDGAATTTDTVDVVFTAAINHPPVVDTITATPAFFEGPVGTSVLAATAHDIDGDTLSYSWSQVSGPAGASFVTPTLATSTVNIYLSGTYVFRITVSDGRGGTATGDVTVVSAPFDLFNSANGQNPSVIASCMIGDVVYVTNSIVTTDTLVSGGNGTFARRGCWAFDISTGNVTDWNPLAGNSTNFNAFWLCAASDGSGVFLGGSQTTFAAVARYGVMKYHPTTGALMNTFVTPQGANVSTASHSVRRIFANAGRLYIASQPQSGTPSWTLKVVNETTGALIYEHTNNAVQAVSPNNIATTSSTAGIAFDATGYFLVTGDMSTIYKTGGNVTRSKLARFSFTGDVDTTFAPTLTYNVNQNPQTVAYDGTGSIFVGGFDGGLRIAMEKFNAVTGTTDTTFQTRGSAIHETNGAQGYGIKYLQYVSAHNALLWAGGAWSHDGVLRNCCGAMDGTTGACMNLRQPRFGKNYNSAYGFDNSTGVAVHYHAGRDVGVFTSGQKPGVQLMAGDWLTPSRSISYDPNFFSIAANDGVLIGNTVYLAFTATSMADAIPASLITGGGTASTRNQLGAYDLSTGLVTSFWSGKAAYTGTAIHSMDTNATNDKLFVAGAFTALGGTSGRFGLARVDIATSAVDAVFTSRLGTGAVAETYHLIRRFGNLLFVCRSNLDTPETTYKTVVLDATTLATLATHTTNTPVRAIAYDSVTGNYWLSGIFTSINATSQLCLAKFNSSHVLQSFALTAATGTTASQLEINAMLITNNKLYCGGLIGATTTNYISNVHRRSIIVFDLAADTIDSLRLNDLTTGIPSGNGLWDFALSGSTLYAVGNAISAQINNSFCHTGAVAFDVSTLTVLDKFMGMTTGAPRRVIPVPALGLIVTLYGTTASFTGAAPNGSGAPRVFRDIP